MSTNARVYGAIRTALITYGVVAYGWLVNRAPVPALGLGTPSHRLVLAGVIVQFALIGVRFVVRRRAGDDERAGQALALIDLVADGITVLLFALGTLGAVFRAAEAL